MKFLATAFLTLAATFPVFAATLKIAPSAPQPGDVLTVTIFPGAGETLNAIGMSAFDTPNVKFFTRADGSARAFLGLPFDRKAGKYDLTARIQTNRGEETITQAVVAVARYFPTQYIRMNNGNAGKMDMKAALRAEKLHVQSKMGDSYAAPLWNGSWMVPTRGAATSAYGRRRYVNGKWWGQHNGADVKAPTGAAIYAANSGRVVLSEFLPVLRGNCTVIDHGCNVFSIYMHQSQRLVAEGQNVAKGQLIGRVGATGFVTGAHLHWEVRVGWEPVDPNKVVKLGLSF